MQVSPYVITISRELGSGGAAVGKRIAERLGIFYLDREILAEAARHFKLSEGELAELEERATPFWKTFLMAGTYTTPEMFLEPPLYLPSDRELFEVESKIMARVARERPAVIIGRGGSYMLKGHPRHLGVFIHAGVAFRSQRVQELFRLAEKDARDLIEKTDKERARYIQSVTGRDWKDLRQYHLAVDSGVMGLAAAEDLILAAVKARFGAVAPA